MKRMSKSLCRLHGKDLVHTVGAYFANMSDDVWDAHAELMEWDEWESAHVRHYYEVSLDRVAKFLQL